MSGNQVDKITEDGIQAIVPNQNLIPELKISWSGDFESLKVFVDNKLNIEGIWSSPGGEKKLFTNSEVNIQWWNKKKYLAVEGRQASKVKRSLLMFIDHDFGKQCLDNIEALNNKCGCAEVSTDVEGVKLDITILEAKLNQQSNVLDKLREQMAELSSKACQSKPNSLENLNHPLPVQSNDNDNDSIKIIEEVADYSEALSSTQISQLIEFGQCNPDGVATTFAKNCTPSDSIIITNTNSNNITTRVLNSNLHCTSDATARSSQNKSQFSDQLNDYYRKHQNFYKERKTNVEPINTSNSVPRYGKRLNRAAQYTKPSNHSKPKRFNGGMQSPFRRRNPPYQHLLHTNSRISVRRHSSQVKDWLEYLNFVHHTTRN